MGEFLKRIRGAFVKGTRGQQEQAPPAGGAPFPFAGSAYDRAAMRRLLGQASEEQVRRVLVVACEFAAGESGLDHPLAAQAIAALREGRALPAAERDELQRLVDELDDRYAELEEAAQRGQATEEPSAIPFAKARAASALWFATGGDAVQAAIDATYEAWFAGETGNDLPERIECVLK